jgi:hypothetical protein
MEDKMNTYNEKTSIKRQKISDDNFIIPNIKNYNETMKQNYNVSFSGLQLLEFTYPKNYAL